VALTDELMAVGDLFSDTGSVKAYLNDDGEWNLIQEIDGVQAGGRFGFDVSFAEREMLVGAPGIFVDQTSVPAGAAYYYEYDRTSQAWLPLGSVIRGDGDFFAANEEFGYSVGLSSTFRVVIGAPGSNSAEFGAAVGRVYTFEFAQLDIELPDFDWVPMQETGIRGTQANEALGFAVAISNDGSHFVAGAPGSGTGGVFLYQWSDSTSTWEERESVTGEEDGEALGSSVAILAGDGSVFAVGGPGYGSDEGIIRVYSVESDGLARIGPDIVGEQGERLGERNSISGFVGEATTEPVLILSTATGKVKRLEFDVDENEWVSLFEPIDTGSVGLTSAASASAFSADTVAVIGDGSVAIYEPDLAVTTFAPSSAPVGAPNPTPSTPTPPTPTIPTTSAPTSSDSLTIVGGPFVGPESTNFGRSVAISAVVMASGAPGSETGETIFYQFADGSWTVLGSLAGEQVDGGFGFDVSVTGNEVLIGAPGVFAEGTSTPVGAAYYYQIEPDGTVLQVGPAIRGDEDAFAALESFGASLSASASRRIVIGAPGSNIGGNAQAGRVYSFEYNDATQDWEPMQDEPLGGLTSENLGVDVAISNDGSRFIAGAPSLAEGYFELFEWDEGLSGWRSIFFRPGFEDREGFGSGVTMITDNGSLCAAGGPNFNGGRGVIRVYQSDNSGVYTQLGGDIIGDVGDALGIRNTFSGDGIAVVAGTSNGFVKRFEYQAALDEWTQVYDPIDTGYAFVSGLATTDAANTIAVTGDDEAVIYEALVV
jgi:hypothetical protein